jgi:nitrate reductase (NAD(P)H)
MNFIVGGTGITPALTIMRAVILAEKLKNVSIRLVFSNKTPADIFCQEELEEIVSVAKSASVKVCHVISRGDEENKDKLKEHDGFAYESGRVNQEILKKHVLSADDDSFCFLCGPPAMIAKAVLPALASLGFDDDQILEF